MYRLYTCIAVSATTQLLVSIFSGINTSGCVSGCSSVMAQLMLYLVSSRFLIASLVLITIELANTSTETYVTYRRVTKQVHRQHSWENCGWFYCSTEYYLKLEEENVVESVNATRDINECARGISGCDHICTNTYGSYICRCNSGYSLTPNGRTCDIDECTHIPAKCGQICSNTVGSYRCSCRAGYLLASDKRSCNDINECTDRSISDRCDHSCSNRAGSFTCTCRSGYRLGSNGRSCNDIDECEEKTSNCSHLCSNTDGSYTCSCNAGFRLASNGLSCIEIDECTEGISACTQICSNTIGTYTCNCAGYLLATDELSCIEDFSVTAQLGERSGFKDHHGDNWILQTTGRLVIVVVLCGVAGVASIIIAVVCIVKRSKERKINKEGQQDLGLQSENATTENDYQLQDTMTMTNQLYENIRNPSVPNDTSAQGYARKNFKGENDVKMGKVTDESIYQELSARPAMNNIYEAIRKKP